MDQQLLVFLKVAEHLSFSRAAKELHVSQPAVSQSVVSLEKSLGAKLLERTNRQVSLTKAGEIVRYYSGKMYTLQTEMEQLVDDLMREDSGTLSIGASYTYGEYILPHTLSKFLARYPRIIPSISIGNTHDIERRVASGELDIGIVEGQVLTGSILVQPILEDTLVVIGEKEHRLVGQSHVAPADMSEERWILREAGSGTREMSDRIFETFQITPKSVMEFGSTQVIKEAVEAGFGLALLSVHTIQKELELGVIRVLSLQNEPIRRDFSVICRHSEFATRAMKLFQQFIAEHHRQA